MPYHAEREAYRDSHHRCQLCDILRKLNINVSRNFINTLQIHHICGGSGRQEYLTNWLVVCPSCHDWIHANQKIERVVCIWIKLRAGEFDPEMYHTLSGKYVEGVLDIAKGHDLPHGFTALIADCEMMLEGM